MKNLILASLIFTLVSVFQVYAESDKDIKYEKQNGAFVGGWYPVFFDEYDGEEVDELISLINSGRAKRIVISYDRNETLAKQIFESIKSKIKDISKIELEQKTLIDGSAIYDHERVSAIVYFKPV